LQGREPQQSQAERQPRGRGHALESSFWSVTLGTDQPPSRKLRQSDLPPKLQSRFRGRNNPNVAVRYSGGGMISRRGLIHKASGATPDRLAQTIGAHNARRQVPDGRNPEGFWGNEATRREYGPSGNAGPAKAFPETHTTLIPSQSNFILFSSHPSTSFDLADESTSPALLQARLSPYFSQPPAALLRRKQAPMSVAGNEGNHEINFVKRIAASDKA